MDPNWNFTYFLKGQHYIHDLRKQESTARLLLNYSPCVRENKTTYRCKSEFESFRDYNVQAVYFFSYK
jgi:hypothetical protein